MHENRETSETPEAKHGFRPVGEGECCTSRMLVSEESDSGGVLMSHSNKNGQPLAESEEGSPLIKENTHPSKDGCWNCVRAYSGIHVDADHQPTTVVIDIKSKSPTRSRSSGSEKMRVKVNCPLSGVAANRGRDTGEMLALPPEFQGCRISPFVPAATH
jgi:hypothetical protein